MGNMGPAGPDGLNCLHFRIHIWPICQPTESANFDYRGDKKLTGWFICYFFVAVICHFNAQPMERDLWGSGP
jgi:hypothetical protein